MRRMLACLSSATARKGLNLKTMNFLPALRLACSWGVGPCHVSGLSERNRRSVMRSGDGVEGRN